MRMYSGATRWGEAGGNTTPHREAGKYQQLNIVLHKPFINSSTLRVDTSSLGSDSKTIVRNCFKSFSSLL